MTGAMPVSVIVVSRERPAHLRRCLRGLSQLFHPLFEIIVVADPAGLAATEEWGERIKRCRFDEANISAARNLGISLAAGRVVAFVDDDAVPEPTWLTHLVAPFDDPKVAQTGGFVRGRNGLSFQWRARVVDGFGTARTVAHAGDAPFRPRTAPGEAVKTEGTNMAVRRAVLAEIGGFDPAFRFYLDETDVNLRLREHETRIVPLAQVHHGFAASPRRSARRAPRDLTEIGASSAVFLRKHAPEIIESGRIRALSSQRAGLVRHMVEGRIEPRDVRRLMATFAAGFEAGLAREIASLPPLDAPEAPFLRFVSPMSGRATLIAGRSWQARDLAARARAAVAQGTNTTVLHLSPTILRHRVSFHPDGYWEQRGGLFGPSERDQPPVRLHGFRSRVALERARLAGLRGLPAGRAKSG